MVAAALLSSLVALVLIVAAVRLIHEAGRVRGPEKATFDERFARVMQDVEDACNDRLLVADARARVRRHHAEGERP